MSRYLTLVLLVALVAGVAGCACHREHKGGPGEACGPAPAQETAMPGPSAAGDQSQETCPPQMALPR